MPVELRSVCQPRAADDVDGGGHAADICNGGEISTAAAAGSRQRWRRCLRTRRAARRSVSLDGGVTHRRLGRLRPTPTAAAAGSRQRGARCRRPGRAARRSVSLGHGGGHAEDIRNGGAISTAAADGRRQRWRPGRSRTGLACISAAGWCGDRPRISTTGADTNGGCRGQPPAGGSVSEDRTCPRR